MKLEILDFEKFRIACSVLDIDKSTTEHVPRLFKTLRVECSGRVVATSYNAMVVADYVTETHKQPDIHLSLTAKVKKSAKSGAIDLRRSLLTTDKGDEQALLPGEPQYPNYQRFIDQAAKGTAHSKSEFGIDMKQFYDIASAFNDWSSNLKCFWLRHVSSDMAVVETPVPGLQIYFRLLKRV